MPLIFIIGYEQILVIQTLMPLKKDRAIFINSVIGATIGVVLNILLVPIFKSVGSSIVWLCSELAVFTSAQLFVIKYTGIGFPLKKLTYFSLISILPVFVSVAIRIVTTSLILRVVSLLVICIYYFTCISIY